MKTSTLTIRLDKDLNELLRRRAAVQERTGAKVAREALRRQLRISQFEALRLTGSHRERNKRVNKPD